MAYVYDDYVKAADFIQNKLNGFVPEYLLILGSGLGSVSKVEKPIEIYYKDIPGFRASTAPGHAGKFVCGYIGEKAVAVMNGRLHSYEGYGLDEVTFPIRVMKLVGITKMIVTNAAGCVNTAWNIGDIMLITDHIRLTMSSPLCGPNISEFGPRFNDMGNAYDKEYATMAREVAAEIGMTLREGSYMFFPGPQYETPAEIRAARILGADAVGMSTVPEVTVAAHCGIKTLGFSLLTNMAAGVTDAVLDENEVIEVGNRSKETFGKLIFECLKKM